MFSVADTEHYLYCEFQLTTNCISADLFKYSSIEVANIVKRSSFIYFGITNIRFLNMIRIVAFVHFWLNFLLCSNYKKKRTEQTIQNNALFLNNFQFTYLTISLLNFDIFAL